MQRQESASRMWLSVPIAAAVLVFLLHALLFAEWLIDDAGISFAYARNLANGSGLVSQSGAVPVEGFSNPLWTLLVATLYWIGVFDVGITPKVVAAGLGIGALVLVWRDLSSRSASPFAVTIPLVLIAICSPFVIWVTSGLENALLAFLVVMSCSLTLRAVRDPGMRPSRDVLAGVVAALAGLTRPDAVLYAPVYPLVVAALHWQEGQNWLRVVVRRWGTVLLGFVPVYGAYIAFRRVYFGEWVPNTYYAKARPSLAGVTPGKFLDLIESATGDLFWLTLAFLALAVGLIIFQRRLRLRLVTLLMYLSVATGSYLVMPSDWMGEFRFATAFFPLFFWTLAEVGISLSEIGNPGTRVMWMLRAACVVFVIQAATIFAARSLDFEQDPPVPLATTQRIGAEGFYRLASALGEPSPSLLTPDLGGLLLDARLRIFDLAGLCDKTIARSLSLTGNVNQLHDYVFVSLKPTFIHTAGTFQRVARLHEDPRLESDYVPVFESWEAPPEWDGFWNGRKTIPPWWADYVRRDALGTDPEALGRLRQVHREAQLWANAPWSRPPDRLRSGWPQVFWAASTIRRQLSRDSAGEGKASLGQ